MPRILIGVDFSDCGRRALQAGINLAIDIGSDVRLVHAFPTNLKTPIASGLGYSEVFQMYASENETAEAIELTTEWADKARKAGLDVDIIARPVEPAKLILSAAEADEVAMIVVGSNGKSGFKKLILGSVAQSVVQRATKPVLVVPAS